MSGALLDGRVAQAQVFANDVRSQVPANVSSTIDGAVSSASTLGADQAGTNLSDSNATAATSSSASPATTTTTTTTTAASAPAQANNGETAAIGYFYWILHNSHNVKLYYGACNSNGCHTDGDLSADLDSNVFYAAESGMHWYNYVTQDSGTSATITKWEVRLFRDITNSADTDEYTVPCSHTSVSAECNRYLGRGQGYVQGHWYYIRVDDTLDPNNSDPASSFQIQNRRYDVINSSSYDWEYLSYKYHGN